MEIYYFIGYAFISIIILGILLYVYWPIKYDEYEYIRNLRVKETIEWLYEAVNSICYRCNMSPNYTIVETTHITSSEKITNNHNTKGIIYLVIWNNKLNRVFNNNILLYSVLHEIAYILSPSNGREDIFDVIKQTLINSAISLGYYDITNTTELS